MPPEDTGQAKAEARAQAKAERLRKAEELARIEAERAERDRVEAERLRKIEAGRLAEEARKKRATEAFRVAGMLESQSRTRAALNYFRDIIDDYPDLPEAGKSRSKLATLVRIPRFEQSAPYPVVEVLDGMTIRVKIDGQPTTVKLFGMDPLPKYHSKSPRGPWEDQARDFLRSLAERQSVFLAWEPGADHTDRSGEISAYAYRFSDNLMLNREIIARGFGKASKGLMTENGVDFRDAEERAKVRKVGLWAP